jgi:hypothetical protein
MGRIRISDFYFFQKLVGNLSVKRFFKFLRITLNTGFFYGTNNFILYFHRKKKRWRHSVCQDSEFVNALFLLYEWIQFMKICIPDCLINQFTTADSVYFHNEARKEFQNQTGDIF